MFADHFFQNVPNHRLLHFHHAFGLIHATADGLALGEQQWQQLLANIGLNILRVDRVFGDRGINQPVDLESEFDPLFLNLSILAVKQLWQVLFEDTEVGLSMAVSAKRIRHIVQAAFLYLLFKLAEQHVLLERVIKQFFRLFNGEGAVIEVGKLTNAPVNTLWLYLILGMIFGVVGPLFNTFILRAQDMFQRIHGGNTTKWVLMGGLLGGMCGVLGFIEPNAAGGGFGLIPIAAAGNFSVGLLLFMFISRVITTVLCFSSGAPGGIFAPMLALGTLLGTAFGMAAKVGFPAYHLDAGTFAVAGMGALLAASLRAPLTGIVLVLEMTDNYQLILPMIITCLGATLLAQFLGGKPLYSTILARTLAKQEAERAAAQNT